MRLNIMEIMPVDRHVLAQALELALDVFMEFEAPDYDPAGVETFRQFIEPESIAQRMERGTMRLWGAWVGEELAGVAATRGADHVSMLFVGRKYQRRGIARALLGELCRAAAGQGCAAVTVNASHYGVPAYERMGFEAAAPQQERDGMLFTPMVRRLG